MSECSGLRVAARSFVGCMYVVDIVAMCGQSPFCSAVPLVQDYSRSSPFWLTKSDKSVTG